MERLDPDEVARINAEHLITTPLVAADLLFVFGTRDAVPQFVDTVVDLWSRRFFKHCIISGGPTPGDARSECEVIKSRVVAAGIPSDVILEEHRATNTGENVRFSLPIIEASIGLRRIETVIALGQICTSKRYLMTLQKYWPQVDKMLVPVNYFDKPVSEWHEDPTFRDRVVTEWRKIGPYKARGFIVDWP